MCKAWETAKKSQQGKRMEMVVYEANVEGLARHMLLMTLFLHPTLNIRESVETFLEVFGNVLVQERTLQYIGRNPSENSSESCT